MSTSQLQPDAPETEELVAYLDGELSADACRRVERRLSSDADYRRRLSALEQAWSALEALPPTVVDDDFARTTIEMVAVAAERDATADSASQAHAGRRRAYLAVVVGVTLAAAAFVAARWLLRGPNELLVDDLPVIAQRDLLMQLGDVEYLRGLSKLELKPTESDTGGTGRAVANLVSAEDWQTPADRRAWIEQLSPQGKAELAANLDLFAQLPPATQDQLRRLEREIAAAPDHDQLRKTLADYAAWLQRRTEGEQLELRELPMAERLRRVEQWLGRDERTAEWRLSPEDENALQDAVLEFVAERRPQFMEQIRGRGDRNLVRQIEQHPTAMVALMIIGGEMRDEDARRRLQERLTARLSPEAQEYLDDLPGRQRRGQLWRWIDGALRPKLGPEELERFFTDELDNNQREYLLSLPRPEMDEQLRQMYIRSQVGLRDGDWGGGFGRPGPFGPGGLGPGGGPGWNRGRGPGERPWRDGPPREFDDRRFGRGGFPPGPGGRPPGGPPPNGPPPDGREWREPPNDGGPPPEPGPPPEQPI